MKLHDYFRSSASFRVRIALNLKNIQYEQIPVHLLNNEQRNREYLDINPQGLVPSLLDKEQLLTQSLAIIEYLEECYPIPAILPKTAIERAKVRSLSQLIASDIHPLNNLRVLRYLNHPLDCSEEQKNSWYQHWVKMGFDALEELLSKNNENLFCFGNTPTLADICLFPQVYNARRYQCDLAPYKTIQAIVDRCLELPAFIKALPENQPDAKP